MCPRTDFWQKRAKVIGRMTALLFALMVYHGFLGGVRPLFALAFSVCCFLKRLILSGFATVHYNITCACMLSRGWFAG